MLVACATSGGLLLLFIFCKLRCVDCRLRLDGPDQMHSHSSRRSDSSAQRTPGTGRTPMASVNKVFFLACCALSFSIIRVWPDGSAEMRSQLLSQLPPLRIKKFVQPLVFRDGVQAPRQRQRSDHGPTTVLSRSRQRSDQRSYHGFCSEKCSMWHS